MGPAGRIVLAVTAGVSIAVVACSAHVQSTRPSASAPAPAREILVATVASSSSRAPMLVEDAGLAAPRSPRKRPVGPGRPPGVPYTRHFEPYQTVILNEHDAEGATIRARPDGHCYVIGRDRQPVIVDCPARMMDPDWDTCLDGLILEIEEERTCICERPGTPVTKAPCIR